MRQATAGIVVAVGLIGLVGVSVAWAEDMVIPPYRGEPGSTTQEWDFMTGGVDDGMHAGYPQPDGTRGITHNPYGTASLNVAYGHWDMGVWYDFFLIDIFVPNRPDAGANSFKNLQVQVTYYDPVHFRSTSGWVTTDGDPGLFDTLALGDGWYQFVQSWTIVPNPDDEWVRIHNPAWSYAPFGVSEIVIDTICVPEPVTLALVGLGAAAGLWGRRRRQT